MAEDLKPHREVDIAIGDLKTSVDGRFDALTTNVDQRFTVTRRMLYFLAFIILSGIIGGFAIYKEVGALNAELAALKNDIKTTSEQLYRLPQISTAQTQAQTSLARIEERLAAAVVRPQPEAPIEQLALGDNERALLRKVLAATSKITGDPPVARVGEIVPASLALQALPEELLTQVPKLRGTRYAVDDKSGLILIAAGAGNKVLAVF
jgi:septal ring factor EnvC (AmiA/AmiB activator)